MSKTLERAGEGVLALVLAIAWGGCGRGGTLPPRDPDPNTVAVGYGQQPRDNVTGSVASVSQQALKTPGFSRIEELLQSVPGVQVVRLRDGDFSVRIRGARSLLSSEDPLLVIDGTPVPPTSFHAALEALSPAQVASIDVLKDAGATAVYGVRGANGVILISTKRGS